MAEPEVPVKAVIPVEDLDKIEKLLDVFMNVKDMPNLSAIKQSCMEELAQMEAALEAAQLEAQEEYNMAMADYEAEKRAQAKAAEEEKQDAA